MKKCKIIIGKNFGDEGKGKLTDAWAKKLTEAGESVLVIKNNGGAQAGHTVEEGAFRFVFHQMGSGSYRGCDTFLGSYFFPDLLKLSEEIENFEAVSGKRASRLYISGDCVFVTPFDVLLNSLLESSRGRQKHGSCGMGIFEARLRKEAGFGYTLQELLQKDAAEIARLLFRIRKEYVGKRLQDISADGETAGEWLELLSDDNVVLNSAQIMYDAIQNHVCVICPDKDTVTAFLKRYDTLLFENAQGLLLDEDNRDYFPYLTPSHTGLCNVAGFWERYGLKEWMGQAEVGYVTRSYVTRHGAGRLDFECAKEEINGDMMDLTNVPNPWQDSLRYAYHPSGEAFWQEVRKDLAFWRGKVGMEPEKKLFVTHLDETDDKMMFQGGAIPFLKFVKRYEENGGSGFTIKRLDENWMEYEKVQ